MLIGTPQVTCEDAQTRITVRVDHAGRTDSLWFSVDAEHEPFLSPERQDSFVVALLLQAMKEGQDLRVEGTLSERLFYHLTEYFMPIVCRVIPSLRPIVMRAEELSDEPVRTAGGGVATGFSAGVDSFCVLADHSQAHIPERARVTHLLFHNVGAHAAASTAEVSSAVFRARAALAVPAADALGLPLIRIDSNLNQLLDFDFPQTHVPRNAAAALVLQKLFRRFLYASAVSYEQCAVAPAADIAYVDPVSLHLLSTESIECVSSGCQHSRVQKTLRIAEVPLSKQYLNVCVNGKYQQDTGRPNCSSCWKCERTLLVLEIAGLLEEYAAVFDLDVWARHREDYSRRILLSRHPLEKEVVAFAGERGYPLPPRWEAVVRALARRVVRKVSRALGR